MSNFYDYPTPSQRELDAAMARAIRDVKRDKSLLQKLAQLFTCVRREQRRGKHTAHPGGAD